MSSKKLDLLKRHIIKEPFPGSGTHNLSKSTTYQGVIVELVRRTRESVGAAKQVLLHSGPRQTVRIPDTLRRTSCFPRWILNLVVAGYGPTTIRSADGSIYRHAIRPVGQQSKPFSTTSEEDKKIGKQTSLNRQFLGKVAGGRVGPSRVADCVFLQRSNFRAASRQKAQFIEETICQRDIFRLGNAGNDILLYFLSRSAQTSQFVFPILLC